MMLWLRFLLFLPLSASFLPAAAPWARASFASRSKPSASRARHGSQPIVDAYAGRLAFANPRVERQGSIENGLNKLVKLTGGKCGYVAVLDSARPLVRLWEGYKRRR
ncbi:hypothetical protein ACHAWF_001489 [Thalassiosira exigua]